MAIKRNIVVLVLCALFLAPAYGESVKDLQKKQKKLQEEIEQTNKMLKQTKKDESATMNKLQLIGQNIKTQKKLINTLDNEITALNREMRHLNATRWCGRAITPACSSPRCYSCSAATVFSS